MYLHFWFMMYFCFDWVIHDRGRYINLYMFLVSHYLLIYIYELFMIYVFIMCYVKSRSYFCLLVFSTHAFMRLLSVYLFTCIFHTCIYAFVECFRKNTCKVEFNQPSCWLYSVPNLLVFQYLVTLYLGGFCCKGSE